MFGAVGTSRNDYEAGTRPRRERRTTSLITETACTATRSNASANDCKRCLPPKPPFAKPEATSEASGHFALLASSCPRVYADLPSRRWDLESNGTENAHNGAERAAERLPASPFWLLKQSCIQQFTNAVLEWVWQMRWVLRSPEAAAYRAIWC